MTTTHPWDGTLLAVTMPVTVRVNRIGPHRQRCTVCGRRRVAYCLQATFASFDAPLGSLATSEHRCAACWGIRER